MGRFDWIPLSGAVFYALNSPKIVCRSMLRPDPLGSLQHSPDPIAELRGRLPALWQREGKEEREGGKGTRGKETSMLQSLSPRCRESMADFSGFFVQALHHGNSNVMCQLITGKDVTASLTARAVQLRRRARRDVHDNSVPKYDDPRIISVNDKAVPPTV